MYMSANPHFVDTEGVTFSSGPRLKPRFRINPKKKQDNDGTKKELAEQGK